MRHLVAALERRRGAASADAGVTLIEVVVATVILGILASSVLALVISAQKQSVSNRNRVAAANLAAREIEYVREQFMATSSGPLDVAHAGVVTNAHPLAGGAAGSPLVLDGTPYTVVRSSSWDITAGTNSACVGGSIVEHPALVVSVRVTWPGMGNVQPVTNTAVLAPERGDGLATTASFAAVQVTDSKGQPSSGRTVVVSSPSESATALTDGTGCAVLQLNPPTGGATYTARFSDSGYVDITGTTSAQRSLGIIKPGVLNHSVQIALDKAASVTINITGGVSASDVAGATVGLYQAESSGSSIKAVTMAGLSQTVTNLWPTNYTAFFGVDQPATMPAMVTLVPGGTGTLDVPFEWATLAVTGTPGALGPIPAPTLVATTPGATSCTGGGARAVSADAVQLVAGTWSFWLSSPVTGCLKGLADQTLASGPNPNIAWASTALRLTDVPMGAGAVWISPQASGGACSATNAVKIADNGGAEIVTPPLPGGSWYVFVAPDSGGPGTPCFSAGAVSTPYGQTTTFPWPGASVTVTNVPAASPWHENYQVIASRTPLTCSTTRTPSGATVIGAPRSSSVTGTLPTGSWYLYRQSLTTAGCLAFDSSPVALVGPSAYTINFSTKVVTSP